MAKNKKGPAAATLTRSKSARTIQKTILDLFSRNRSPEQPPDDQESGAGEMTRPNTVALTTGDHMRAALPTASPPTVADDTNHSVAVKIAPELQTKRLHPIFTKSRPAAHIPSQIDVLPIPIIEIQDDELITDIMDSPLTMLPPDSSEAASSRPPSPIGEGRTRHDPIIVESSPVEPAMTVTISEVPKQPHSLFVARPSRLPLHMHQPKHPTNVDAPYPTNCDTHIRGPQSLFTCPPISYPCRTVARVNGIIQETGLSIFLNYPHENSPSVGNPGPRMLPSVRVRDQEIYLTGIREDHKRFRPAIARILDPPSNLNSFNRPWAQKWRPTRAAEVLGNESNALYLRDWLRALELQIHQVHSGMVGSKVSPQGTANSKKPGRGTKRPHVMRAVSKKRRNKKSRIETDDEFNDGWIVDDEDIDERSPMDEEGETTDDGFGAIPTLSSYKPSQNFLNGQLKNTILLAGPPGTGKTASVYACAEELGWDVFEVYPGIGRRNGANIEYLIGDVGKNHMVGKTGPKGESTQIPQWPIVTEARNERDETDSPDNVFDAQDTQSSSDFGFLSPPSTQRSDSTDVSPTIRQSCILLEEVDILFKDDVNFWPAVVNFIRDCRRPVVCTCNDLTLVPTFDLPLQATLMFQPCESDIAASYLQGVCSAEGQLVERATLVRLYQSMIEVDSFNVTDTARVLEGQVPDLRRTIHALQLGGPDMTNSLRDDAGSEVDQFSEWGWDEPQHDAKGKMSGTHHADLMSFADSYLTRAPLDSQEALVLDSYEPSGDDELGHTVLYKPGRGKNRIEYGFGWYDRDIEIASSAIRLSRGTLEAGETRGPRSINAVNRDSFGARLFRARVEYQEQMGPVILRNVGLSGRLLARTAVHLEYGPFIRQIVAADDEQERKYVGMAGGRSGRVTRNSQLQRYVRTIGVSAIERDILRATLFGNDGN